MKAKTIQCLFAWLFLPCVVLAQSGVPQTATPQNDTDLAAEVRALREALLQTQKQMAAQQHEIEALKEAKTEHPSTLATPYLLPAGSWTLKMSSAPPIRRTTSPPTSPLYRIATRRRAI
jgi:hypothetical protein